jgi:hypothetical protein
LRQQAADLGRGGDVDHQRVDVERQLARRHLAAEQRRDQHLLGALRVLDAQQLDGRRQVGGQRRAQVRAASGLFSSTPTITRPAPVDAQQVADPR